MMPTTLFTWGYYGWGNATPQLVEAVDAVEQSRGFNPPLFVDIRIRRSVRARGFTGPAFEKLLGPTRHRWMKSLGNNWIETRTGPSIQIADPSAAGTLLNLALQEAKNRRRLLFFCSCQFPRAEGQTSCHRDTVADLVLQAAKDQGQAVEIIEWPGGEPTQLTLDVPTLVFKALQQGRTTIPLGKATPPTTFAGLPWGSLVTVRSGDQSPVVISAPAGYQRGEWVLPVFGVGKGELPQLEREAAKLRRDRGLEGRSMSPAS
jgi:hypothetical protein